MHFYDFDLDLQKVFNEAYSHIAPVDWRSWLDVSSREEYESLSLKLSGLSSVEDLLERLKVEKTDPKLLSVNVESFLASYKGSKPLVICHTSGTSGGQLSNLKFYPIPEELVRRLWAPGIQAIFQASGLNKDSSAVIFVPSRIVGDGMSTVNGKTLIKLYSAEFSQRLMLSLIKPHSYLLYEYKDANNLKVLEEILSLDKIGIISAPASTVLRWADLEKLRQGLRKTQKTFKSMESPESELLRLVDKLGIDAAAVEIRKRLSESLSDATIVFSISSITEGEWSKIHDFMRWKKSSERFTNLYVGSEIGPFAATIARDDQGLPVDSKMHVFPLTIPVIERRGERDLISRSTHRIGKLLLSRFNISDYVINIDTGDVITIESQEGLPRISGQVLRAGFRLKTNVVFHPETKIPREYHTFVGDYFELGELEIINPRCMLACLAERCKIKKELTAVIKLGSGKEPSVMTIPSPKSSKCHTVKEIQKNLPLCPGGKTIEQALKNKRLVLKTLNSNPVETETPKPELLKLVRKGELPKGVLKHWPLYLATLTQI